MTSSLNTDISDAIWRARSVLGDALTPSVRLGVTGLARSGKTVFITALVRNLISGGRLPFFTPDVEGRIVRAYLEPQPDDAVPRFAFERHIAALAAEPPQWPDSTTHISQLRVTIEYQSETVWKRLLGLSKLHLDIVDYPGEWLIDLPLLEQSFAAFSADAIANAEEPRRRSIAAPWLAYLARIAAAGGAEEQQALEGAALFKAYLAAARVADRQSTLPPGRFLMAGDLEGSPLLTFCPLPAEAAENPATAGLFAMMARRFESYKAQVVRPFFNDHFRRLDRQIVLVDVLGALDQGAAALADLEQAMDGILRVFRPGAQTWLSSIMGRRIDKVLFAATKADHLPATSHDRLGALLDLIVADAAKRAMTEGAGVKAIALAALRATRETTATVGK
ncbi:MAG: YcjX family protein, partial [Hyphomicrobium sp.]